MPNLDQLEKKFREAQEAFAEDRSSKNKDRYKDAKRDFEHARIAQRQEEEADPNHPRGAVFASVNSNGSDR